MTDSIKILLAEKKEKLQPWHCEDWGFHLLCLQAISRCLKYTFNLLHKHGWQDFKHGVIFVFELYF